MHTDKHKRIPKENPHYHNQSQHCHTNKRHSLILIPPHSTHKHSLTPLHTHAKRHQSTSPSPTPNTTWHQFPGVVLTSLVQGPFTSSGLTTLCHRCWHWTSFLSGKPAAITSHFSPCCSTSPLSFYSTGAVEGDGGEEAEEGLGRERKELDI